MQQNEFDYQNYLNTLIEKIKDKVSATSKLYLEVTGNLIDQSNIKEIVPELEADTYKKAFAPFKYDMDILFCIKAQDVIDNAPMGPENKPFRDFLQIYLKKIENQFGVKPHIVINLIDIENMYDVVFGFETHFQKLGYRVWEKYKIKAYSHDIAHVLSEDGFGNDDHIPITKKLILIAGLTPECGKLTTAIAQLYLDQEIGIDADYAKLEILPNYAEVRSYPLNVMARAQYLEKVFNEDFDTTLEQIDLYERGVEKHAFIQMVYKLLERKVPEHIQEYILWQLSVSEDKKEELSKLAKHYLEKMMQETENQDLKDKLESLMIEL